MKKELFNQTLRLKIYLVIAILIICWLSGSLYQGHQKFRLAEDEHQARLLELEHTISALKDTIAIGESDMITLAIDLGRYEYAIDGLTAPCKKEIEEILSESE